MVATASPLGPLEVEETQTGLLDTPAFVRLFQLRGAQIMWLLGAGSSRSAGIKTAGDMIWDFKQRLYRSQKKLAPSAITDIGEPAVQRKLQAHFDEIGGFPSAGAETEYSAYFEATYHSAKDRRAYLDELIKGKKPAFGHLALALLMSEGLCRIVWTTNFDRTVEDAAAKVFGGTGNLTVADLGEPQKFKQAISEHRWPIYGKLHGDFHSESLKNTAAELREQDAEMRRSLVSSCGQQGLAVIGYSGRDASVMTALTDALDDGRGFPNGLFWFKRRQDKPFAAAKDLIEQARKLGIDAHFVEAEAFDELFVDLLRYLPQTSNKIQALGDSERPRLVSATPRAMLTTTPAIRTNALPIVSLPAMCRIVDCTIGGYQEIEEAIAKAEVDIIAHRTRAGVLAFGRDSEVRKAFDGYGIRDFNTHPIAARALARENSERALVRDALFRAVGTRPGLTLMRRGRAYLILPDVSRVKPNVFNSDMAKPIDQLTGTVPKTTVKWKEACTLRIDYRLDQLWLLLEPTVITDLPSDASPDVVEIVREFVRERRARRHNRAANAVLDGWISTIFGGESSIRIRSFGIGDGVDAEFEMMRISGFSGRGKK